MKNNISTTAPLRVAQILGRMDGGGIEQVVMNYYRHIDHSKLQFDFYIFESSGRVPEEEIKALGGRIFRIPGLKNTLHYVKTLTALLKQNRYPIAHCHMSTLSGPALKAARIAGIPIRIIHNHSTSGGKRELVRNFAKAVLKIFCSKNATHRFACSKYAAEWMYGKRPVCGIADEKVSDKAVYILRNAVDSGFFRRDESKRISLREELGIPESALVFGHIGRFCPQKNQSFLLDIFEEILKLEPDSYLIMAGTGDDVELIRERINKAGLSERALLLGQRDDTDRLYNAFDCFILPSNYEGLGMVGIEAQAVGVGCVFSHKVPSEVKLSEKVSFLSLTSSSAEWARVAVQSAKSTAIPVDLASCGYEISVEAERLSNFYFREIKNQFQRKE